ncbi:MAG: YciI family protein [Burkholderiales bacterium]
MRFMIIVKNSTSGSCASAGMPEGEFLAAMRTFNEELAKAGALIGLEGLHPVATGTRVRISGNRRVVTDGPFAETKEAIGGYWLWELPSKEDAIEWVKRCPALASSEGEIEIRQVIDAVDFADKLAPGLLAPTAPGRPRAATGN